MAVRRRRLIQRAPRGVRTFGVEEELLLVDAVTLRPHPVGELAVAASRGASSNGPMLSTEFKQEQIEVVGPPQTTFEGQLRSIRDGRRLANESAAAVGARAVALATSPWAGSTHLVGHDRYLHMAERFGLTAAEQLTCGLHVHVLIESRQEGVAVLDRLRVWLPVLLALSSNSPFWMGQDTGFASYRYQAWNRWPTSGPTDLFGSLDSYDRVRGELLRSGVSFDDGMLYYDARLSARYPTVEVRICDIPLVPEHSAVLATLIRALVESCAREWGRGRRAPLVSGPALRAWSWHASRFGVDAELVSPLTGAPATCREVAGQLLEWVGPVLAEYGEADACASAVADLIATGGGAGRQRQALRVARSTEDGALPAAVVRDALAATHEGTLPEPGAAVLAAG